MSENKLLTYRDTILKLVPRWLRAGTMGTLGTSGKILYAMGVQLDAVNDALVAGVKRRFPGLLGEYDSLPLLGIDRRIARGPYESDAGYAARLLPWLDDHQVRGGPYAMLRQLHGYWVGAFPIALVYRTGKRFMMATDGTITRDYVVGWVDTSTDLSGNPLCHWKLFFYWDPPAGNDGLWGSAGSSGDAHWGDGGLWGSSLTPEQVQNLMLVPTEWNAAHPTGYVYLIPATAWPFPLTWQDPGTVQIAIY